MKLSKHPYIRFFILLIDVKTLILSGLSLFLTYFCYKINFIADIPISLIFLPIIFPIFFSINNAYLRRELVTTKIAIFKASALSIYLGVRDWISPEYSDYPEQVKQKMDELTKSVLAYFLSHGKNSVEKKREVFIKISEFSNFMGKIRGNEMRDGERALINEYINQMIRSFHQMINIFEFKESHTLALYSQFFIYIFPVLYAPYFAGKIDAYPFGFAYLIAIMYSVVLGNLDTVEKHMANLFDQVGQDDVNLTEDEFTIHLPKEVL